ncbi:hypothetical protein, partial [Ursidibacter sp. B-7004-1]
KTDVEVKAGNVTNAGEITASEGNANITADTKVDNTGTISAKTNTNITAPTANLGGTVEAKDGAVVVDASEKATVSGNVTGKTGVTTKGKELEVTPTGNITSSNGDIAIENTDKVDVKKGGKISTLDGTGNIKVGETKELVNAGDIVSKNDVEVVANKVDNSGKITATDGKVGVVAKELNNKEGGEIKAKGEVSLSADDITNAGNVTSTDGEIKVAANNNFTNTDTGNLKAKENVTVDAVNATVSGNVSGKNVDLNA